MLLMIYLSYIFYLAENEFPGRTGLVRDLANFRSAVSATKLATVFCRARSCIGVQDDKSIFGSNSKHVLISNA